MRYSWGFALLARDGWAVAGDPELSRTSDGVWLCPTCCKRSEPEQIARTTPVSVATARQRAERPHGKLRVLLVDDQEAVRRSTARLLGDFDVVSVSSPLVALQVLENDRDFNAVLSDVMMPQMSGPEFYATCSRKYPDLARCFVFLTGNPEAARVLLLSMVASVGAAQAPVLLDKPSSSAALQLALFAAAAHRSARSGTYAAVNPEAVEVKLHRG